MRRISIHVAALGLLAIGAAAAAKAQGVCGQLWVERNSIYKDYGYCFKTARAIGYFGNGGCVYEREGDIPMSRADRARINQIVAQERAYGCR
ncbi:YARHG domain-containing protein [Xanthobacteraceae bacterium Astr-EGSB]|uniref:YARHG domain-containing protein n=1 Tax=Astrobacterium formosum TaxID=3069710 RepID=UPI0027AF4EE4|nr:YARHG domain-containing protein [Xanthobacteraceae bacterium Astr-EGSB]